jgi:dTMP kinase
MNEQRGYFIVFEGLDGSGLTTQTALLRDWFIAHGHEAVATKEPSEGPAGAIVRWALTRRLGYPPHRQHGAIHADSPGAWEPLGDEMLALLYAADRLDHVRQEITPRLERGVTVVCDRYRLSSLAYQALGADEAWVATLNSRAPAPNLTIFLAVPVEVCAARMAGRRGTVELYEETAKLRRIRANYDRLIAAAQAAGERIVVVDGSGTVEAVHAAVIAACQAALPGIDGRG